MPCWPRLRFITISPWSHGMRATLPVRKYPLSIHGRHDLHFKYSSHTRYRKRSLPPGSSVTPPFIHREQPVGAHMPPRAARIFWVIENSTPEPCHRSRPSNPPSSKGVPTPLFHAACPLRW